MRNRKILQPIRNWKLRKKLIVSFVALVMLPVLTLSGYSMWQMQLAMSEKVKLTFSDSIYQISSRISRQFERYNAALNFLSLNRQLSNVFENEESSYYDQYEAMNYVLEPTLMMVQQLAPELESIGIYTSNHHLKERNEAVLYLERLEGKPWFERFSMRQRLCWTMDDGAVTGLARMMKLSVKTPDSMAYIRVDPEMIFDVKLENHDAYGMCVYHDDQLMYSRAFGMEEIDLASIRDRAEVINGQRYMMVTHDIESTDWSLCIYCPYDVMNIDMRKTFVSLGMLAIANLILLTLMGCFIADSISSRLSRLNDSMSAVAAGHLEQPIELEEDSDEIGELSQHFGRMVASLEEHITTNYENRLLLQEAELKALQSQINPHFLYNSLSVINWMAIDCEAMHISDITCALSSFYRSVLNNGSSVTTVREELRNIEAYLKIQTCMHDGSFETVMDIHPDTLDCEVIGVMLQPLVENAIEHGIDCRREMEGARLIISAQREGDALLFAVEDNGPGMTEKQFEESVSHSAKTYGLKNVQDRLKIAYGEKYGLALVSGREGCTRIEVRLPRKVLKNHAQNEKT